MAFSKKMDDSKIKVNLDATNLKDGLQYCKPKEQLVLFQKFGLLDWVETPLQRIGELYGLTRERVRQIENQGLMRFRRLIIGNEKFLSVIAEAKEILAAHGGFLLEKELVQKVFDTGKYIFSYQEIKLILISDFDITYLKRNKHLNNGFFLEPIFEDVLTNIALYSNEYFTSSDVSSDMYAYIDHLKNHFWKQYPSVSFLHDNNFYINFFPSIKWISTFHGKVGLATFNDANPKTIKTKILFLLRHLNKPLHYNELAKLVAQRFPKKKVKVSTVHNELVKNNALFVNMGLGIYGLKERWFEWGSVKDIVERIFRRLERPLAIKDISREVLKEKMVSPNTIVLTLQKYKELFERVDKGVYQLKK
jgi:hypothetical protein